MACLFIGNTPVVRNPEMIFLGVMVSIHASLNMDEKSYPVIALPGFVE